MLYDLSVCVDFPVRSIAAGNHHRQAMPLGERVYHCPCCLLAIDRDLNAARNIKALGLQSVGLPLEAPSFSRGE
ncbi:MAG: zinc ribbon domain-containing protein [Ktedonobacteraceae bacterium]